MSPRQYLQNIQSPLLQIDATRKKMDALSKSGHLASRDLDRVYESLYLRVFTVFENYLESYFFALLLNKITPRPRGTVARVDFNSDVIAREIVYTGKSYVDWLPYDKTEGRAKLFFRGGRPFCSLSTVEKQQLTLYSHIRNHIAHRSRHSQEKFETIPAMTTLSPRERTPAGYLRNVYRVTPEQTRFELFLFEIANIARLITFG